MIKALNLPFNGRLNVICKVSSRLMKRNISLFTGCYPFKERSYPVQFP